MNPHDQKKLMVTMMKKSQEQDMPCEICNAPTRTRGIFVPFNAEEFGAREGQTRMLLYAICDDCAKVDDNKTIVEQHLRDKALELNALKQAHQAGIMVFGPNGKPLFKENERGEQDEENTEKRG